MAAIVVTSVPATSVSRGTEQVIVNRRDSKENGTVPQAERCRAIIIPELSVPDVPSKFTMIVLDALRATAVSQLSSLWKDAGWPGLTEVPAEIWSVDALLMHAAKEAESKRLSKDTVSAWWKTSKLCAYLTGRKDEKLLKSWEKRILSLAAPALTLSEEACNATIATIGKFAEDAESMIGSQLVAKLAARVKKLAEEELEIGELEVLEPEPEAEGEQQ